MPSNRIAGLYGSFFKGISILFFMGFPGVSDGKESAYSAGDWSLIPWRREWLPTPIFLPGEFHGQSSLAGYRPWCCKELNTTDRLALIVFSIVVVPIYIPTNSTRGCTLSSTPTPAFIYCL